MLPLHITLLALFCIQDALAAGCTICRSGEEISKPQQELNIQTPFPLATCQDVNNIVRFVDETSENCAGIRIFGGLCGCPAPQGSCRLCPEAESLSDPSAIPDVPSPILDAAPQGVPKSCGFVDSFLQATATSDSEDCLSTRTTFELDCLCASSSIRPDTNRTDDDDNNATSVTPNPTPSPSINATEVSNPPDITSEPCSLCPGGGRITNPDTLIPIEIPESPIPIETCRDLEALAVFVPSTANECANGIQLMAGICGCSDSASNSGNSGCLICPNGEVPKPDNHFYDINQMKSLDAYIEEYDGGAFIDESDMFACKYVSVAFSLDVAPDSEECFVSQLRREICGCEPNPKMNILNWCRRTSAFLSLLGSLYIVISILRDKTKVGKTYHQIVLAISSFDIIGSLAYCLDFLLLPSGASIPNTFGDLNSCTVQGVMTQLSFTGVLMNLVLALYFLQTVVRGWKEHQFIEIRRYVYGVVLFVGVGLALGGIPLYEPLFYACAVPIPPFAESWTAIIFFFFLPFGLSLIGILWATFALFLSVYKLEQSSSKWRFEFRSSGDSMTVKVFWRCFYYLLAFLVPWPMYFASYFVELTEANYPFFVALQICIPCQGILNFLVYRQRSKATQNANNARSSANKSYRHIKNYDSRSIGMSQLSKMGSFRTQTSQRRLDMGSSFQNLNSSLRNLNTSTIDMSGRVTRSHDSRDSIDEFGEEDLSSTNIMPGSSEKLGVGSGGDEK